MAERGAARGPPQSEAVTEASAEASTSANVLTPDAVAPAASAPKQEQTLRKRSAPREGSSPKSSPSSQERPSKSSRGHSPTASERSPNASAREAGSRARANGSPGVTSPSQQSPSNGRSARRGASPTAASRGSPGAKMSYARRSEARAEGDDAHPDEAAVSAPLADDQSTSTSLAQDDSSTSEAEVTSPQRLAAVQMRAQGGMRQHAEDGAPLRPTTIEELDEEDEEDEDEEGEDGDEANTSSGSGTSFLSLSATVSRGAYHQCGTARRVKVYELKGEQWFDRGTGYCAGVYDEHEDAALLVARMEDACQKLMLNAAEDTSAQDAADRSTDERPEREPYVLVVNEELETNDLLLRTRVVRDDVYQRQQDTLVVWTEPDGKDMALSFQEAEGCQEVWEFLTEVQKHFLLSARGDGLEIDEAESMNSGMLGISNAGMTTDVDLIMSDGAPFALPAPRMDNLAIIDMTLKDAASRSIAAREKVAEWVLREDYLLKLVPVFHDCEDLEQLDELHRLCAIMYTIIMLNDNALLERMLRDDIFLGIVGMLEYDPEFPRLKASYRDYLTHTARYKQVVPIQDASIVAKIHQTFRLQYLKDVILARTLDDSTFAVLNSLIFYHQADIVMFCTSNQDFLKRLFALFQRGNGSRGATTAETKAEGIIFLQQLCAVGKQVQLPSRLALYRTLTEWGLLIVLEYALRRDETRLRNAAAEILTSIIEYDASGVRAHILDQEKKGTSPLLGRLADILHEEEGDLGLKTQITESFRILFDSGPDGSAGGPALAQTLAAASAQAGDSSNRKDETERFLNWFYDGEVDNIFKPLRRLKKFKELESHAGRPILRTANASQSALYNYLCELLTFVIIHHSFRSQYWVNSTELGARVASLLFAREKHLRLAALRFFRACLAKGNQFTNRHFIKIELLGAILSVVEAEASRDNLVTSACLEFFEHIRKEPIKSLVNHIMEKHGERVRSLTEHSTIGHYFQSLVLQWEKSKEAASATAAGMSTTLNEQSPNSSVEKGSSAAFAAEKERRMRDLAKRGENRAAIFDAEEENYFQDDDEEEDGEDSAQPQTSAEEPHVGLVAYADDVDDDERDEAAQRTRFGDISQASDADEDDGLAEAPIVPSSGGFVPSSRVLATSPPTAAVATTAPPLPEVSSKRKKGASGAEDEDDDDDMMGRLAKRKPIATEGSSPATSAAPADKAPVPAAGGRRLSINLSTQSSEKLSGENADGPKEDS